MSSNLSRRTLLTGAAGSVLVTGVGMPGDHARPRPTPSASGT